MPRLRACLSVLALLVFTSLTFAQDAKPAVPDPTKTPAMKADVEVVAKAAADATTAAHKYSDISWLLVSCTSSC